MSWRENTSSKPTSLARAVSTAWSATSDRAGSGRPLGGCENRATTPAASVELPPLPNAKSRPPASNRAAIAAAVASRSASRAARVASRRAWLVAALASADAARSVSSGPDVALVAFDEGVEEVRHASTSGDRRAGVDEHEVAGVHGPDQQGAHRLDPGRSADRGVVVLAADDLAEAALVRADDARRLLVVDGLEEPRVLEADVGELPEDVVAEHEATVVAGGRIIAEPDHVLGRAIERARTHAQVDGGETPRLGPPQGSRDGLVAPGDNDEGVPGAGHRPQRRGGVVVDECHRG